MNSLVVLFKSILHTAWVSTLLILVILLIRALFRKKLKAKTCYILWILLMARLVFPFSIHSPASIENAIRFAGYESLWPSHGFSSSIQQEQPSIGASEPIFSENFYKHLESISQRTATGGKIYDYAAMIWLFGVLAVILVPVVSYSVLRRELKHAKEACEDHVLSASLKIRTRLGIVSPIRIKYSSVCTKPALTGIIRPVVLLPLAVPGYAPDKIYAILLHELVHYKKRHLLLQWLFWVVKSVFWFNPLMWVAHTLMKQDAEYWCDEEVLLLLGEHQRAPYGNLILDLVSSGEDPFIALQAAGFGNKSSEIKKRIRAIARKPAISKAATLTVIVLLLCLIPVFFTVMTSSPQENRGENLIRQTLALEEATASDGAMKVRPTGYEYDSQSRKLTVFMDYRLSDKLMVLKEAEKNLAVYTKIVFPGSTNPEVRKKSFSGEALKDGTGKITGFSFEVKGYDKAVYGMAKLILEGAQLNIPVDGEYAQSSFTLSQDALPYRVSFDPITTLTFEKMSVDPEKNVIGIKLTSESQTGVEAEPTIFYSIQKNGMMTRSLSSFGTIGSSGKALLINLENQFDTKLDGNETLQVNVHSITLFINRSLKDEISWRFPIETE